MLCHAIGYGYIEVCACLFASSVGDTLYKYRGASTKLMNGTRVNEAAGDFDFRQASILVIVACGRERRASWGQSRGVGTRDGDVEGRRSSIS